VLSAPLAVLGVGHGGIDSLREHVNDKTVQWGLLRFQVGGGNFQRTKFISICINGEDTPTVVRARLATRGNDVMQALGTVHAGVDVSRSRELTVDWLIERVLPIFVIDNMDAAKLKQLYTESVAVTDQMFARRASSRKTSMQSPLLDVEDAKAKGAEEEEDKAEEEQQDEEETVVASSVLEEQEQREKPNISSEQALDMLAAPDAPLNWFLFEPEKFELHNAGSGGVEEMHFALDDSIVLFGVARFVFKYMKEKSSVVGFETNVNTAKYYFIHWMGEETPPLKRSKWNRHMEKAQAFVRTKCAIAISKTASTLDDLKLRPMIRDLYQFTAVESECQDEEGSVEAYLAAIAEEQRQREAKLMEMLRREEEERQAAALAAQRARDEERMAEEAARQAAKLAEGAPVAPEAGQVNEAEPATDELPSAVAAILEVRNACGMWDWVLLAPMKPGK